MKLTYFQVMAKGLGPALVCELSGLPWVGPRDTGFTREEWPTLKASGKCPFGQLPILEIDGQNIGQSIAIVNYIGKRAGMEGQDSIEFAMSQALLAEGEDLYNALQKFQPTIYVNLGEVGRDGMTVKGSRSAHAKFWKEWVPEQLEKLEALLGGKPSFTSQGQTVGELYLWAMLHQMRLCNNSLFDSTPGLKAFYAQLEEHPGVRKVLSGESTFGPWTQYFVNPDADAPKEQKSQGLQLCLFR